MPAQTFKISSATRETFYTSPFLRTWAQESSEKTLLKPFGIHSLPGVYLQPWITGFQPSPEMIEAHFYTHTSQLKLD